MDRYTYCPKNKYENEANAFAITLLTYGIDLAEYEGCGSDRILLSLGIPADVVKRI